MNKEKIKAEFQDFIDTASEQTLLDFVKFMKERRMANTEFNLKINEIINPKDSGNN